MISFFIKWDDLDKPWMRHQDCWSFGTSFIQPFKNPVIEAFLIIGVYRRLVVVRERLTESSLSEHDFKDGYPELHVSQNEYDRLADNIKRWPLEFITVEIIQSQAKPTIYTAELQAGEWGVAPVYLISTEDAIVCDWDITKLYSFISIDSFDLIEAAFFLSGLNPYNSKTLFKCIRVLTERSKAILSRKNCQINYPEPAPTVLPHALKDKNHAEVTRCYREILSASLRRWSPIGGDNNFACELSGGLDSANVTAIARTVFRYPVSTYGMLLDGEIGKQQSHRRQEFTQKFQTSDHIIDAIKFPPLLPGGSRLQRKTIGPYDEPYSEALESMLSVAVFNNHLIILTGIGGDELVLPDSFEIENLKKASESKQRLRIRSLLETTSYMTAFARAVCLDDEISSQAAPKTIIPETALKASQTRAPVFLRKGIWPINPLCTPELVRYCHTLPPTWRAKKRLHRELLLENGISNGTVNPQLRENFSGLMTHAMSITSRSLIQKLFSNLLLSELGLIDGKKIKDEYDNYINNKSICTPGIFYDICVLELTIRCIAGENFI